MNPVYKSDSERQQNSKTPCKINVNPPLLASPSADIFTDSGFAPPCIKTETRHVKNTDQKPPTSQRFFQNHIRAAGATGGLHGSRMKHDRGDSSGLSPFIPEWNGAE